MPSVLPAHLKRLEAESIHIMREVVAGDAQSGDAVLDRQRLERHASRGDEGLLSGQAAVFLCSKSIRPGSSAS